MSTPPGEQPQQVSEQSAGNQSKPPADTTDTHDFVIERYKFILKAIETLNENTFKYLTLFQVLATALVGAGIGLFVSWKELKIDAATARLAAYGLLDLFVLLGIFVSLSLLAGMFTWFDYRREEVHLLDKMVGRGFRNPPNVRYFWRWYETYLLLFVILTVIAIYRYADTTIIPLIK